MPISIGQSKQRRFTSVVRIADEELPDENELLSPSLIFGDESSDCSHCFIAQDYAAIDKRSMPFWRLWRLWHLRLLRPPHIKQSH